MLATTSAVLFLVVFLADLFGLHTNPYIGILFFLVLPGIFVVSLPLIPLGAWLARRREHAGLPGSQLHWPRLDLNDPVQRRGVFIFAVLTLANVVIVSLAAYRGVEYMDSVQFCGADLPHGDETGIRRLSGQHPFARGVRPVPHRRRRDLVCEVEAVGHTAAVRRGLQYALAADSVAGERTSSGPRHL